ncbi:hypothetical protein FRB94_010157 [Tulasnella sp. JGI-2019a]|nr:hypothetical protein FRB94_010157 [Tulasnella sp. JGI-2019a]KAG9018355.1 hypothetical protein FRB93_000058 [Tulasnella sp. JGI-2019a]KAG9024001.1 hypothetical protein FRB95_012216 [Tulasnella sp. JGI-2019a]
MDLIKGLVSPILNASGMGDTMKLVVIGGTVETARRASMSAWHSFVDSFFLTAHFSEEDYPYDWLMHWLSKQPAWGRSREFEITTRTAGRDGMLAKTNHEDLLEDEDSQGEDENELVNGRRKKQVAFMPSIDTTHTIYYRGHWLRVTRSNKHDPYHGSTQGLKISVVARNNIILKKLVLQAKREYEADMEHRVHIFLADSHGSWRWNGARQKRPLSSIVLERGVKDMLMADARDFLASEEWYADRGIPFRRGYLLHGVPGSGKTSLIHAVAGALGLDIYVISLSSKGMNDTTLSNLMGRVPQRCIVLLEDLDAAFTRGVSRDATSTGVPSKMATAPAKKDTSAGDDTNSLSLSGLLNSLDGVAASEGRILFATTNHIERLDPALSRPGRMDVWIDFKHASKWQAEGIFLNFFPCRKASDPQAAAQEEGQNADPKTRLAMTPRKRTSMHAVPLIEEAELQILAKEFAEAIPENELSVASLQGYLLKNKTRPRECVKEVHEWIVKERETRVKLKKEKEERELREKAEKAEKEAKANQEKAEKEAKEADAKTLEKIEAQTAARRLRRAKEKAALVAQAKQADDSSESPSVSSSTVIVPSPTATAKDAAAVTTSSSESNTEANTTGDDGDAESITSEEDDDDLEDIAAVVDASTSKEAATEAQLKESAN